MRPYIIIYISCMFFSLPLFAEESEQSVETTQEIMVQERETLKEDKSEESSLSSLIENIKTAKAEDRRELMNQLKVELRTMNKEKRQETMQELKKTFAKNTQGQRRHQNRQQQQQFRHQPQYRQLHNAHGQGHRQGGGRP